MLSDTSPRQDVLRDSERTSFTPILERVWQASHRVLAVVFVDGEGECVDYVASIDPYEAKVAGAQTLVVFGDIDRAVQLSRAGHVQSVHLVGESKEVFARQVGDGYLLVLVAAAGGVTRRVSAAFAQGVFDLAVEACLTPPSVAPVEGVRVELRAAVGWPFAPAAYYVAAERRGIENVLGRWTERQARPPVDLVCYRVRNAHGEELTLVLDPTRGVWKIR